MNHLTRTLMAVAALSLIFSAHAGRPLATEDAGILNKSECEWESFGARSTSEGISVNVINTQVACGVGADTQLAVSAGRASSQGVSSNIYTLNAKTEVFKVKDSTAVTVAYGLIGTKAPGEGNRLSGLFVNGVVTQPVTDKITLHGNLGWNQDRSTADRTVTTSWNFAGEYAAGGGVDVVAEVYGDDRSKGANLGTGLRWQATKDVSLNGSLAISTAKPREKLLTVGGKLTF